MTDDLERRLRGWRTPLERNDEEQFYLRQLLDEAADELARLRAENKRLQEALEPFAEMKTVEELLASPSQPEWARVPVEQRAEAIGRRKEKRDAAILRAREVLGGYNG
jgi:hypothetical protein